MIGMKAVRHVGVERQQDVRFRCAYLAHELLAQLEVLHQLRVRIAKKFDALDAEHFCSQLLLALANARHLALDLLASRAPLSPDVARTKSTRAPRRAIKRIAPAQ